jgi:hypothetical protein
MANKWLRHLAQFRRENGEVPPEKVMQMARKSYQSGGGPMDGMKHGEHHPIKMPVQPIKLKGGQVVPYEAQSTDSAHSKVGGKRRTKRQSRRSRRTRRR